MDEVREALELKGLSYSEKGNDYIISCLNPEHEDTNPSMRVDKITGIYHCFSCGFKGTLIRNNDVETFQRSIRVRRLQKKIGKLLYKNPKLPKGANPFNMDFRNIKASTYSKFLAFESSQQKEFIDRIVIPITDIDGDIVLFQGRHKYKSEKDKYVFYPPRVKAPCFPAAPEQIDNSIILVEGMFDMLNLYDKGLTNVVCNFGCSVLKDRVAEKQKFMGYKMQGVSSIYILFDGDKAGRAGASKLTPILQGAFNVETIQLDEGEDPGGLDYNSVQSLKNLVYEK